MTLIFFLIFYLESSNNDKETFALTKPSTPGKSCKGRTRAGLYWVGTGGTMEEWERLAELGAVGGLKVGAEESWPG